MSPASNQHGKFQAEIIILLKEIMKGGKIIAECSVETRKGTKVADVAWVSDDFFKKYGYVTPYLKCPEIMVEIKSPSNTLPEFQEKSDLYFAKGAKEVWICDENGKIIFWGNEGELKESDIIKNFPRQIQP